MIASVQDSSFTSGRVGLGSRDNAAVFDDLVVQGTALAGDTTPPTAPTQLTASNVTATSATLSWTASTDAVGVTGYEVFNGATQIGSPTATSFGITGLACGQTYSLGVVARDAAGNRSAQTTTSATTAACSTGVITFSGTVTAAAFLQAISNAAPGALTVQPAAGQTSFTVTGGVTMNRANVTIRRAVFTSRIIFPASASGSSLIECQLLAADICGADDITWQRNVFDAQCLVAQNFIFDEPAGVVPQRFKILDNPFRNYHLCADESVHSEALYIGYSDGGLVEGNSFEDNGTTGHVFFTWWGATADPNSSWARNICARSNTFGRSLNGYFSNQIRSEIPASSNISLDPNNVTDRSLIGNDTGATPQFIRACGGVTPPSGTTANLWIDGNGGTCARTSPAGAYADGSACASIQAAVTACQPGDTIILRAGDLRRAGDQRGEGRARLHGDGRRRHHRGAAEHHRGPPHPEKPPGGRGHRTRPRRLVRPRGSNITLEKVRFHGPYVTTYLEGQNVVWRGGELGAMGTIGGLRSCNLGDNEPVFITNATNLTNSTSITFNPPAGGRDAVPRELQRLPPGDGADRLRLERDHDQELHLH